MKIARCGAALAGFFTVRCCVYTRNAPLGSLAISLARLSPLTSVSQNRSPHRALALGDLPPPRLALAAASTHDVFNRLASWLGQGGSLVCVDHLHDGLEVRTQGLDQLGPQRLGLAGLPAGDSVLHHQLRVTVEDEPRARLPRVRPLKRYFADQVAKAGDLYERESAYQDPDWGLVCDLC